MTLDWNLILQYRPLICSIVNGAVYCDKEDMQHDVMVYLVQKRYSYDSGKCKKFSAWLWIKVKQAVIDILRKRTHCRSPRTHDLWRKVNCAGPLSDCEQDKIIDPSDQARDYLLNIDCLNYRSYVVLRCKGIKSKVANKASKVRRTDELEYCSLTRRSH